MHIDKFDFDESMGTVMRWIAVDEDLLPFFEYSSNHFDKQKSVVVPLQKKILSFY